MSDTSATAQLAMTPPFESLPRRIFLDSCTAQTLRDYGGHIYEGEPISDSDRIYRVMDGIANVEALRDIFLVNERAQFEWIVSRGSMQEAYDKRDSGHMRWLWDVADHSQVRRWPLEPRRQRRGRLLIASGATTLEAVLLVLQAIDAGLGP